ncbi:hypothetical protein DRE_01319 [Drechslerella stenobrocha 248]|uniref:Uncharacterized protein n=1 Tax=Drechslerella stenobrocha 248 TaxID=1043628 RepID=W7HV95_9PEZI|nr:hypothetical protein DRE_01319 [Drechslerella stenobrocha 248]
MQQENGPIADPELAGQTQAYHKEMERITRLMWNLEEPIESSERCIKELSSRPHALSNIEHENLQSEKRLLRNLQNKLKELGEQRDELRSTPGGCRAQEVEMIQQEIENRTYLRRPEDLAEMAERFRKDVEERREKRKIELLTWSSIAIVVSALLLAATFQYR